MQANSAKVGGYLMEQFQALSEKHSIIGDVRGAGLMLGVEFVRDRSTKVRVLALKLLSVVEKLAGTNGLACYCPHSRACVSAQTRMLS